MNSSNFRGGSFYVEKSEHSELLKSVTDRFKMCTFYLRNSVSLRHQIACQETQDVDLKSAYRKQFALSVLISQSNELIFLPLLAKIDLFEKK